MGGAVHGNHQICASYGFWCGYSMGRQVLDIVTSCSFVMLVYSYRTAARCDLATLVLNCCILKFHTWVNSMVMPCIPQLVCLPMLSLCLMLPAVSRWQCTGNDDLFVLLPCWCTQGCENNIFNECMMGEVWCGSTRCWLHSQEAMHLIQGCTFGE